MLGKERAKKIAKLRTRRGRDEQGLVLVDSITLMEEALGRGLLTEIFAAPGAAGDFVERSRAAGVTVTEAEPRRLAQVAHVETPPDVIGTARRPDFSAGETILAAPKLFGVYLDRVADPGNVGTLARSAAAFGCDVLVLSEGCADPWAPKALRASAGALFRLPAVRHEPDDVPGAGSLTWYRTTPRGGAKLRDVTFAERSMIWLGNEAHGTRDEVPPGTVVDVTIPLRADVESLNVAAAAAILFHAVGGP